MKYIFYTCLILCSFVWINPSFSQILEQDYGKREKPVDPFEDEDCFDCHPASKKEYINRVKYGDRTILRLVVFDTFEDVINEANKRARKKGMSLYQYLGPKSMHAFIGGLKNQDPKVVLYCILYLVTGQLIL